MIDPREKPTPPPGELVREGVAPGGWLDRFLWLVGYRAEQRQKRARARSRLGLDIPTAGHRIHETSQGGSTSPQQEAETMDEAQATQEPTDAEVEATALEEAADAVLQAGEGIAESLDDLAEVTGEAAAAIDEAVVALMPTIVVHYLGFTLNRKLLPTGHFPTKAKLVEAMDGAILNKGWNIGSADLEVGKLPEVGCYREKAKAIAAATRSAKAAAPCRLQILDSNGEEIATTTFRQKLDS